VIEDPLTIWPGQFPYRVLADFGITPRSTQADVEDVAFTLMAEGRMNPTTQQAWRELRDVTSRLLVDLLLYDIDQEVDHDPRLEHPEPPAGLDAFPTPSFIDGLIQFDR
jgi:hypothetical protein